VPHLLRHSDSKRSSGGANGGAGMTSPEIRWEAVKALRQARPEYRPTWRETAWDLLQLLAYMLLIAVGAVALWTAFILLLAGAK
jgi:hypothetical protein